MSQNYCYMVLAGLAMLLIGGCAGIEPPKPEEILRQPIHGSAGLSLGMTQDEVIALWGRPHARSYTDSSTKEGSPIEEWVYRGRYSKIPLKAGYLFKGSYLYFDGEHLIRIVEEAV